MKSRIYLVTEIHSGIAGHKNYSGDVADFAFGPRGIKSAFRAKAEEKSSNIRSFGSIGAGETWLELRDETGTFVFPNWHEVDMADTIDLTKTAAELKKEDDEFRAEMSRQNW